MRYFISFLLLSLLICLTGCDVNVTSENAISTPVFITATLPATAIPLPTQTPLPPSPVPTSPPIEGTTTTQVNVRAETSTASDNLGTIAQFSVVQIIGKDASTSWYRIIYAGAPNSAGWIRAEYVQVNTAAEIPVIESVSGSGAGMSGLVIQKINVRNGPGTTFDALGELNPNDVVFILGKDASGAWMQIEFASSVDGKGWAALEFLKVEATDSLPVVSLGSPTAEAVVTAALPQTSNAQPPMLDGDSMEAPLTSISFSPLGARTVWIKGSVSSADGDTDDWIQFTSYTNSIAIQLFCPDRTLQVELLSDGEVPDNFLLVCTEKYVLNITANQNYLLHVSEADASGADQTKYELVLEGIR